MADPTIKFALNANSNTQIDFAGSVTGLHANTNVNLVVIATYGKNVIASGNATTLPDPIPIPPPTPPPTPPVPPPTPPVPPPTPPVPPPTPTPPLPTFQDTFTKLSLHDVWQAGDNWQLIAPDSTQGRGGEPFWKENGSQWWANPYNPNTSIPELYKLGPNGGLQLGLMATPTANQSYIDTNAGAHMPYVGCILNTSPTNFQKYGYWEIVVSVPILPGFSFQADIENVQITGIWPPEVDLRIFTSAGNVTTALFQVATGSGYIQWSTGSVNGFDISIPHTYAWNWQPDFITFYIDNKQVWQIVPPPAGNYNQNPCFLYLLTGANYIGNGDPDIKSLPIYATVSRVTVYQNKPLTPPTPIPPPIPHPTPTPPPVPPPTPTPPPPTPTPPPVPPVPPPTPTVTWRPDTALTLTANKLTATFESKSIDKAVALTSISKSSGKWYWNIKAIQGGANFSVGLVNSSFPTQYYFLGSDNNGIGWYTFDGQAPLALWQNDSLKIDHSPVTNLDVNGAIFRCALDCDNHQYWMQSPAMVAAFGANVWNCNPDANPATGVGGFDVSGLGSPLWGALGLADVNSSGTLITTGLTDIPTGFKLLT